MDVAAIRTIWMYFDLRRLVEQLDLSDTRCARYERELDGRGPRLSS